MSMWNAADRLTAKGKRLLALMGVEQSRSDKKDIMRFVPKSGSESPFRYVPVSPSVSIETELINYPFLNGGDADDWEESKGGPGVSLDVINGRKAKFTTGGNGGNWGFYYQEYECLSYVNGINDFWVKGSINLSDANGEMFFGLADLTTFKESGGDPFDLMANRIGFTLNDIQGGLLPTITWNTNEAISDISVVSYPRCLNETVSFAFSMNGGVPAFAFIDENGDWEEIKITTNDYINSAFTTSNLTLCFGYENSDSVGKATSMTVGTTTIIVCPMAPEDE